MWLRVVLKLLFWFVVMVVLMIFRGWLREVILNRFKLVFKSKLENLMGFFLSLGGLEVGREEVIVVDMIWWMLL